MIIACTCRFIENKNSRYYYFNESYQNYLNKQNVTFLLVSSISQIDYMVKTCDMLLITGGYDIDPTLYHQNRNEKYEQYYKENDVLDYMLLQAFHHKKKLVLGICRGMQMINVYFNGTLFQDIKNHQNTNHKILFHKNGLLFSLYEHERVVNSFHHQAIDTLGNFLKIEAMAEDGIIEAISYEDFIIGVQWHPEFMDKDPILSYFLSYQQDISKGNMQ